jgi:subtilase family serine protease
VVVGTATPGSDYLALPGTVTIDAGSSSATITVAPIDDAAFETGESVVLTVSADAEYSVGSPSQATVTVVSDDLPPDLVVSAASVPATAGADSDIAVTDTTSNQGGGQSAPSQTGFYLSADALLDEADVLLGTRTVPSLNPSAAHTATTTLHVPASTTTGLYYVFAVADWNAGVEESADGETNNVRLPSLVRVGPDLAVTSLTGPSSASPGATIVISDTTANQGGGSASASTTQYFLSLNAVLDAADVLLGGRSVSAIAPGQVNSGSASVTVPSTATSGTYFVIAKADGGSVVAETSEPNNVRTGPMVKIGADLTVTALTVPTKSAAGAAITVTDTTANQGTGDADASSTGFYLSANLLLDASDVLLGSRAVPVLAAGASNAWTTSLQIPANTVTGTYYVIANSDVGGVVAESSETNNTKFATLYIGPDLVVTAATAPLSATPGATIVVSDTTANQGGGAAAPSTTQYFLSSNATYEATDVLLGSRPVSGLAAGGSEPGSASVVVPSTTPTGVYYVIARADGGSAVPETTETNNTRTSGQVKVGADLVITAGTAPAAAGAGTTIVVSDTTTNQGTGGAGASATGYYLSANALLDAADVQIGSRSVPALAAGASNSGSASLVIPSSTPTGTYYVIGVADAANAVAETLENNNTRLLIVRIGPDLTITAASAAASAVAGTTVAASDTTSNVGGGSAAVSTTYYYLSTNAVFDSSDVLIGTRSVGTVAAGASNGGSTTLTIPAGTAAGTYYIVVMADGPQSVPETTEVNNTRAVLFKITGS